MDSNPLIAFIFSCKLYAIYSATSNQYEGTNFLIQQIFWYGVGAIIIAVVMQFDSDQLRKLSWILYGFGILLLLILAISPVSKLTPKINGDKVGSNYPLVPSNPPNL